MVKNSAILFSPDDATPPTALTEWLARQADVVLTIRHADDLMAMSLRGRPRVVAFDARSVPGTVYDACRRLTRDSYTGVVPVVVLSGDADDAFDESRITARISSVLYTVFELFATMLVARRDTGVDPFTGQDALMRLAKSQQSLLTAGGDLARVHGRLLDINRETGGVVDDCPDVFQKISDHPVIEEIGEEKRKLGKIAGFASAKRHLRDIT